MIELVRESVINLRSYDYEREHCPWQRKLEHCTAPYSKVNYEKGHGMQVPRLMNQ